MIDPDHYLRINEIKNYLYCARISFYTLCMGIDRETDLSRGGIAEEQATKKRMQRRKGAIHAVQSGVRQFDVTLTTHRYRLVGRLDEMIETDTGVYLVDYKDTQVDYGYWTLQMAAYACAAEEMGYNVLGCYVYAIPKRAYEEVSIRPAHRTRLGEIINALYEFLQTESCPPPVNQIGKCRVCQYARFCNDVA